MNETCLIFNQPAGNSLSHFDCQNSIKKILIEKPNDWQAFIYNEQKKYFAKFDHYLDGVKTGNLYLQQAEVAQIVINKIHEYDSQFYDLMAYCIMPNHVHLVIDTALQLSSWEEMTEEKELASISRIMKFIKGGSAHQANSLLNRTGAFWQGESYDHWIRDYKECKNIIRYTLQNPVKAGLTANWQDWPYSYVNENYL